MTHYRLGHKNVSTIGIDLNQRSRKWSTITSHELWNHAQKSHYNCALASQPRPDYFGSNAFSQKNKSADINDRGLIDKTGYSLISFDISECTFLAKWKKLITVYVIRFLKTCFIYIENTYTYTYWSTAKF